MEAVKEREQESVKEADIRKYAGLMKELGLTGLEITQDNLVVRLERNEAAVMAGSVAAAPVISAGAAPAAGTAPGVMAASAAQTVPGTSAAEDYISVKSPIVGIFYAAPAENAEPYVSVGDRVQKGKTLCIVEAMKLMNEISSEYDGEIAEICVKDGQMVEYGTELFRLKR